MKMITFYSKLGTEILKRRKAELEAEPILTHQEGQMLDAIKKVLAKRGN